MACEASAAGFGCRFLLSRERRFVIFTSPRPLAEATAGSAHFRDRPV